MIQDNQIFAVDVGIGCVGTQEIPKRPNRGKRDTDASWAKKEKDWSVARDAAYTLWDELKRTRENEIEEFVTFYQGEILDLIDGAAYDAAVPADSFTVRIRIVGKGLRDFVLNYPYIFEVEEPDEIALPRDSRDRGNIPRGGPNPVAPAANAPAVCVIDSGIQEGHTLLEPAIDAATSHSFLPNDNNVGDFVLPSGHGTRVAGAILYGESVPQEGAPQLPYWIQNARVLDNNNGMPVELFPPAALKATIERFHNGPRGTRIFNHSINSHTPCRTRYMSAWAAQIDLMCAMYDVLVIQSAGNLERLGTNPMGVQGHLTAGRNYPNYLYEDSTRIANPAQSLQAITVGSVAYGAFAVGDWTTFAIQLGSPSAFSRSGFGVWDVIKPEVVEFGGDFARTANVPADIGLVRDGCPNLVRSTMSPGPAADRDGVGTSFAAPKVTKIAASVQSVLPDEPAILYRALVVQSARWPQWAEALVEQLRHPPEGQTPELKQQLLDEVGSVVRCIGYGVPDETRATRNTDYHTTFITTGEVEIHAKEGHVYQVPIPPELRGQADEFDVRIEVTLSYVAQPRRTRRHLRHYLSTWVDWKSSKLGEDVQEFLVRALREETAEEEPAPNVALPWTLQDRSDAGFIRTTRRNSGTVQKDWAVVKSNALPENFCIAVVGHQGWSRDPDSTAKYAVAVTFEIMGQEIKIYEPLRVAVADLQTEIEAEEEVEVEVEDAEE